MNIVDVLYKLGNTFGIMQTPPLTSDRSASMAVLCNSFAFFIREFNFTMILGKIWLARFGCSSMILGIWS